MPSARVVLAIACTALLMLGGCGRNAATPELMNIRSSTNGPDEFSILPSKSLEMPEHKLWAEFTAWLLQQGIKAGTRTKEQALKDIYDLAHDAPETKKPAWREAYKQIKSL